MNIGIVTPYYPDHETANSGIANHYATLAQGLVKRGNKVLVIHIRPVYSNENVFFEQHITGELTLLTFKVQLPRWLYRLVKNNWAAIDFLLKIKGMIIAFRTIGRLQNTYDLQVIETTSYYALCFFYLFKKQKIPVVVRVSTTFSQMMDNYYSFRSGLLRRAAALEIAMIKKSRFLVTHAHDHAREIEKLYGVPVARFTIIPHGIALPELTETRSADIKILYVGRFEYRKGIDVLLHAIPTVLESAPQVCFRLVGNDPGNNYEKHFREQNSDWVSSKVIFSGNLPDTSDAYNDCTIFVAPSRYESFGLIYIEAMSFGKPVIGCKVGGVSEIIDDYKNGLFAAAGNAADLADKIAYLIKNEELRETMGREARKTVEKKFTEDKLAENSILFYREAIAELNIF